MWSKTAITDLLKIDLPLIQAPMAGGVTTPALIAAVSNAGGLGSLAAGYLDAETIRQTIKQIRQLTNRPFAVNLFVPEKHHATEKQIQQTRHIVQACCPELNFTIPLIKPPYAPAFEEQMQVIIEENVPVFSFTFGIPSEKWITLFKNKGTLLIGTATTLEEAKWLEARHVDAIVAQGSEAGGHRGTFLGTAEEALVNLSLLIPSLAQKITLPIIAAGGMMNAADILSVLKSGAAAVQMGTAFLCCPESGAHPFYKKILLNSTRDNTILTRAFSGKLARGIINKFITRMQAHEKEILNYPIQNSLTSAMRKEAAKQNCTDFMSMWAGAGAYLCREISATKFIQQLNDELTALLNSSQSN